MSIKKRNRVEVSDDGVLILHQAPNASWRQQERNAQELLRVFWEDRQSDKRIKEVWVETPHMRPKSQRCA
jgi:hypothetical protein